MESGFDRPRGQQPLLREAADCMNYRKKLCNWDQSTSLTIIEFQA